MSTQNPTHLETFRFFFPLALTQFMITVTHTIINAGLARLPSPEESIAAYAVAKSLMSLAQNPSFMVRQVVVSLARHKQAYLVVKRVVYILILFMCLLLGLLGWTPLGRTVLENVMGLTGSAIDQAAWALRVFTLFPIAAAHRNFFQGMAILGRVNYVVPVATLARLLSLLLVLTGLLRWSRLPGAGIGAIAFTVTMGVEAFVLWLASRTAIRRLPEKTAADPDLTSVEVARFYWPLMITSLMGAGTLPAVNAGIARGTDPQTQLAAFAIAWGLAFVLVSPANMVHQVSLAFTKDGSPESYRRAAQFSLGLGVVLALVLAVISFTPLAPIVLGSGVGASEKMLPAAIGCMQVLFLLPIVRVWREYCWGVLMRKQMTKKIGSARTINLILSLVLLWVGVMRGWGSLAVVAAAAIVFGEFVEGLILVRRLVSVLASEQSLHVSEGKAFLSRN